jgi:hypothetical protein
VNLSLQGDIIDHLIAKEDKRLLPIPFDPLFKGFSKCHPPPGWNHPGSFGRLFFFRIPAEVF